MGRLILERHSTYGPKGCAPGQENTVDEAVRVALPGTCGELVQGTLDGGDCLVSCPIERYSIAEVCLRQGAGWTVPADAAKTRAALQAGLSYIGQLHSSGVVRLHTQLLRSRGYGSSTADIGATLYALGRAVGRGLTPAEVARLALQVEPSDSSLFPGLALWDHRYGQRYEDLGASPPLTVLVLDPGGEVDTVAFNQLDHRRILRRLAPQHREAFTLLHQGLQQGDVAAIGAAATLSATAHQAILFNPWLTTVLSLARDVKALGVCRAHSGTLLGLLLDPRCTDVGSIVALTTRRFAPALTIFSLPLVSGGPRLLTGHTVRVTE
jgi:L-threonine kinase